MTMQTHVEDIPAASALDALIARYGLIRIALALAAAPFRWRHKPVLMAEADLSDHIRRDVGLPPRVRGARDQLPW